MLNVALQNKTATSNAALIRKCICKTRRSLEERLKRLYFVETNQTDLLIALWSNNYVQSKVLTINTLSYLF